MTVGRVVAVGGANVDWVCRTFVRAQLGTSNPGLIRGAFGGVARNVACNLARLGVPVALLSAVGDDDAGKALLADCQAFGVDCSLALTAAGTTSTYVATLDADGELLVAVSAMDVIERLTPQAIAAREGALATAGLIFADANLAADSLRALAEIAAWNNVPLVLDPVSTLKAARLNAVIDAGLPIFLIAPNRDELGILTGLDCRAPGDLAAAAKRLQSRNVERVVVGLGAAGAFVASAGGETIVAPVATKVEDVTGAGDAAIAATIWALRAGRDLIAAAKAGQAASALTIAAFGAMSPDLGTAVLTRWMDRP